MYRFCLSLGTLGAADMTSLIVDVPLPIFTQDVISIAGLEINRRRPGKDVYDRIDAGSPILQSSRRRWSWTVGFGLVVSPTSHAENLGNGSIQFRELTA